MAVPVHLLIFLSYTLAAAATPFALHFGIGGIDPNVAAMSGGLVWLAGMVMHEVWARFRQQARLSDEIVLQRAAYDRVMGELDGARASLKLVQDALEAAAAKRNRAAQKEIRQVVDEVRVLKALVDQLASRRGAVSGWRGAGGREDGMPAAISNRPAPPVARDMDDAKILDTVRDGLKADRVDLYLQPVVELPQRRRRFFECFSRIRTEDGEMITPAQDVAIAEREGLISAIDNMLLFRCVQLVRKTRQRRFNLGFFCNISRHTLADPEFFSEFVQFMANNQELAGSLIFEFAQGDLDAIDESVAMELDRLAGYGFRYSLDRVDGVDLDPADLAAANIGYVKLAAAAMIEGLHHGGLNPRALKMRLEAHNIALIVDKVESEPDLIELLDFEIDYGQGYLFGEPRLGREP
jgi:cyclic-di-GMP phosphodiesterase TipF (flagellum assembly factor)